MIFSFEISGSSMKVRAFGVGGKMHEGHWQDFSRAFELVPGFSWEQAMCNCIAFLGIPTRPKYLGKAM